MKLLHLDIPLYSEPFRARRRREKENSLRKAVKYIKQYHYYPVSEKDIMEEAQRRADNFQICSCSACGNPRHNDWASSKKRLTFQERKALVDMDQQFQDFFEKECETESKKQYEANRR